MTLPELYMTPSGKRIEIDGNQGVFVDKASGELAWPVYECTNPDCPGLTAEGPHLFIWTDPRLYAKEDGTLGTRQFENQKAWRDAVIETGGQRQPTCDQCMTIRNPSTESPEQGQKYSEYPVRHVLPATAARRKELDAEHQARKEYLKAKLFQE